MAIALALFRASDGGMGHDRRVGLMDSDKKKQGKVAAAEEEEEEATSNFGIRRMNVTSLPLIVTPRTESLPQSA